MRLHSIILPLVVALTGFADNPSPSSSSASADARVGAALERQFDQEVRPFLETYCVTCHSGDKPKARFDLSPYQTMESVLADFGHWELILDMLGEGEMPPEDEEKQPDAERRAAVVDWIQRLRHREAARNAGDPGIVLARRLSNAEYDYTIRDLTGVDLRPTREFPIDPANEAGFDNSGESLSLSPALLKKYLDAARGISEHLLLLPDGFTFVSHPVVTDTDRDKYAVKRLVDFYRRQPTDYADYFLAAWRLQHESGQHPTQAQIRRAAEESGVSKRYLESIWNLLTGHDWNAGPIADLRAWWHALPEPDAAGAEVASERCVAMANDVHALREKLSEAMPFPKARGIHSGSQTFVLWHNRKQAENRRTLHVDALQVLDETDAEESAIDRDLVLSGTEAEQAEQLAAFEKFCSVFPDAFYISERGREFLGRGEETSRNEAGRLLSAGFHSMMGYFRDDQPLCELILDEAERRELDELWRELDFVTSAPMRQHTGFVWFERTDSRFMRGEEFDFARAEDKDVTSSRKIRRLGEVYLAKAVDSGADDVAQEAIREYFVNIDASIRWVEQARAQAEPSHVQALLDFASRAYRRPLTTEERADLEAFYRSRRDSEGGGHEEAIRDGVVSVLVSPHFWYRVDLPADEPGIQPLSDVALASRLSYFLWSSMPDEELMSVASSGKLHRPEVLIAQMRRLLEDPRARGLAVEFGGNWLGFRQFEHHNSVDRERFPAFDNDLRRAMFEEPVRFFSYVLRDNRSVLDFLFAEDTFVNANLAAHYGLELTEATPDEWRHVPHAGAFGRGGLLPMAVFQTQHAPGLRTSPVKRGYWVVKQLLGEHIPPPPPNVPELPSDEGVGDLTLREQLMRHRQDKNCAACHDRFDAIGLAFEGYGPVGERRDVDLGGRPVDTRAIFPGGVKGAGLDGLKAYLRNHRQDEFVESLCRKLFSYALGRTLILSDDAAIQIMETRLRSDGYRIHGLIEAIVTSPQFLTKRGRVDLANR